MNIYDIKRKANEVLINHDKLFKVLLYIGFIQAVFSAISELFNGTIGQIISLIISVLTVTLGHGAIVASLKTVNNMEETIDEKEDALVGITKIGKLFPTYFLYDVIMILVSILVGVVGFLLLMTVSSVSFEQFDQLFNLALNATVSQAQMMNAVTSLSSVYSIFMVVVCLIFVVYLYFSLKFGLFRYILQKYDLTGMAALKESSRLMKGNKWTLFKLQFSFIGWMILTGFVTGIVMIAINSILPASFLATLIEGLIGTCVSVYFYDMKLNVCMAVFYEELDYEDKYVSNQDLGEGM